MKKIVLIFISIICFMNVLSCSKVESFVYASGENYARVKYSSAMLYRNPTNDADKDNVFFYLPLSYFVLLLSNENETFYRAKYLDVIGYVKKSDVECVIGTPKTPFADNISFRVYAQNGLNLRANPTDESGAFNRICVVPYLETNLQYYGEIEGDESVPKRGKSWIFCKYKSNETDYTGYLYKGYCDLIDEIESNTEPLSVTNSPTFEEVEQIEERSSSPSLRSLSVTSQVLILVGVSIPALFLIYLLFRPTRIIETNEQNPHSDSKRKPKRKKFHKDYYEYED